MVDKFITTIDLKPPSKLVIWLRMNGTDVAFASDADDEDALRRLAPAEAIGDSSLDPGRLAFEADEERHRQAQLGKALSSLDDRSREIIESRWLSEEGQKQTLGDLAKKFGVSAERIRQIEKRAMEQMRLAATA